MRNSVHAAWVFGSLILPSSCSCAPHSSIALMAKCVLRAHSLCCRLSMNRIVGWRRSAREKKVNGMSVAPNRANEDARSAVLVHSSAKSR